MYIFLGACVGFVVGLTGVGGGSLMTPALVLLFGISPMTAVGTDLLYAAMTKSAGALVHGIRGNVDWPIVALLALGSVPTSAATVILLALFGRQNGIAAQAVTVALGLALLLTVLLLAFRERLLKWRRRRWPAFGARRTALFTVMAGAAIGTLVAMSSVGAGAIGVTALLMLHPDRRTVRIVGTDIAHAVPLTLLAGLGHALTGSVDASMLACLLAGSLPGIVLGSMLAPRFPERGLRLILSVLLAVVGLKLVVA